MASHLRFLSLLLLSLVLGGHSLIYDQVTDLPQLRSYDYVVVGGMSKLSFCTNHRINNIL